MQTSYLVQDLFSPISFPAFLRDYFEQKPLLVRGKKKDRFDEVLSMAGIDEILSAAHLRYPEVKLVAGGMDIPTERYIYDAKSGWIDTEALYSEHAAGATIIINYLHRHWRPLSYFCRELERRLSLAVQANIYLTPRFSQGFDVHYDTHDVIVLQIAGEKNWRLYGNPIALPGPRQPYDFSGNVGPVRKKCTLKAGDCLYIPRGYLHDATASMEPSLHVTIGLLTSTWGDVLLEAVNMLVRSDASLRRSLPTHYALGNGSARDLRQEAKNIRQAASTRLPIEQALEVMAGRFISRRPQFMEQHFLDLQQPWLVDARTPLARRSDILFRHVRQGDKVCLQFYRKKVLLPRFLAPALKFITRAEGPFCAADVPGDLTEDGKVLLCRHLMMEGFLKTAPAAGQPPSRPAKAHRSAKRALRVLKEEHFVVIRQGSGSGGKKPDVD